MTDQTPTMGAGASSRNMSRSELQKQNSELKKELEQTEERSAGQDMREGELDERERDLQQREERLAALEKASSQEGLPPRVSTNEGTLKEHSQAATNSRATKDPLEMGKKFPDITPYLQKYGEEMQLMWVNDVDGDVQRWIDLGAEPVPWNVDRNRHFEGITDQHESKWVRIVGGESRSGAFYVYLLMIGKEDYDRLKLAPVRHRQELIQRAMRMGVTDESEADMPTYAPNLPSGERGLEQLREVAGEIPGL